MQPSDTTQNIVLLSFKYWQKHFGGDRSAVGKTLELDHRPLACTSTPLFRVRTISDDAGTELRGKQQVAKHPHRIAGNTHFVSRVGRSARDFAD